MRRLRIARGALDGRALESRVGDERLERALREPEVHVLELSAHPVLGVREESEHKLGVGTPDRIHVVQSFEGVRQAAVGGFVPGLAALPAE